MKIKPVMGKKGRMSKDTEVVALRIYNSVEGIILTERSLALNSHSVVD
jgi:hypothetical protein